MWSTSRWLLAAWSLSACASSPVWGTSDGPKPPDVTPVRPFATQVLADNEPLALLGPQRRWLVEVQISMRWTRQLVDTLADWWSTETLRDLEHELALVEAEIERFALRHRAPRLTQSWSPIDDPDTPLARRYDDMMRRATANRGDAEQQATVARDAVVDQLNLADRAHPEIALLVSTVLEHLTD